MEQDLGPIRVLVSVAGVLRMGAVIELSDEDWDTVLSINATGVFHICRAVARHMVGRGFGSIVTVSSNAAAIPRVHMGAYAASKAAVTAFTKCLGLELARHGIRCNVVAPGSTDTNMQRSMWRRPEDKATVIEGSLETFRTGIPLGRLAQPEDVADAVLFLSSPRARHITMQELRRRWRCARRVTPPQGGPRRRHRPGEKKS